MSLQGVRASIVDRLQSALGGAARAKAHGGRFSLAELKRHAVQGPAVLVACLGVVKLTPAAAGVEALCAWGAFVVCADKPLLPRDAAALGLVSAMLPLVPGQTWERDDVDQPRQVRADNLYTSELDKEGVALWALTWQQEITLGQVDPATLDAFLTAHVDYDINQDGSADAADDIALPQ